MDIWAYHRTTVDVRIRTTREADAFAGLDCEVFIADLAVAVAASAPRPSAPGTAAAKWFEAYVLHRVAISTVRASLSVPVCLF